MFRGLPRRQPSFDKCLRGRNRLLIQCRATGPPAAFSGRCNPVARALGDKPPLEVGNRPEDVEYQLAGGRGRVDAFLETDQVDVVRLEVLDRFEQLLEGAPEAVETCDTETVAGAGMVDQLAQPRSLELPSRDHVDEDTDGAGLAQAVFLGGDILVSGRHAGIAEDVSLAVRSARLFNIRFGDGAKGAVFCPFLDFLTVPLFVPILQTVSKRAAIFLGHVGKRACGRLPINFS